MTTIRYFVPEDGDLESEPNVFLAPKSRHPNAPPSFGQIRDAFPLPGQYHFRFKSALVPGTDRDKNAMPVWMDVVEERQPVPIWKGGIVVKVSRISMEDDDDDDDDDDFHAHHPAPAPAPRAPATAPVPRPPPSHGSGASGGSIDDLLGSAPAATPAPAPNTGGSLLDFNDHHHQTPTASAAHNDFLGMTSPPAPGVQSAPTSGGYHGNPNMYAQQQQMHHQQQHMQQQQQQQMRPPQQQFGAFGDFQW
eukprot:CAMPEP_0172376810 /NCGR_PEP_ID=MMETSP1060-20121228/68580_1 /TAXON_ID=37318 /ORGANISM="Pseudo-nitzschia pungens, Strain cf. cingulata" /LENGTH=248 /DNA_ID=CAMNT_0013104475 /DNA_START=626 /DNA_END=1369 /DNA_ORIENTATION=-